LLTAIIFQKRASCCPSLPKSYKKNSEEATFFPPATIVIYQRHSSL
jgi:hypothetical protein